MSDPPQLVSSNKEESIDKLEIPWSGEERALDPMVTLAAADAQDVLEAPQVPNLEDVNSLAEYLAALAILNPIEFITPPSAAEVLYMSEFLVEVRPGFKDDNRTITLASLFYGATTGNEKMIHAALISASRTRVNLIIPETPTRAIKGNQSLLICVTKASKDSLIRFILYEGTELALHDGSEKFCKVLHWAIDNDDNELLRLALKKGANVDQRDWFKETALHKAASRLNLNAIQLLIDKGADVNSVDESGATPLHYARVIYDTKYRGESSQHQSKKDLSLAVVWNLLEHSHQKQYKDDAGNNLFHLAVIYKNMALLDLLLEERPAVINEQNDFGRTALHLAAIAGNMELIDYLLGKGADAEVEDINGFLYTEALNDEPLKGYIMLYKRVMGIDPQDMAGEGNIMEYTNVSYNNLQRSIADNTNVGNTNIENTSVAGGAVTVGDAVGDAVTVAGPNQLDTGAETRARVVVDESDPDA